MVSALTSFRRHACFYALELMHRKPLMMRKGEIEPYLNIYLARA